MSSLEQIIWIFSYLLFSHVCLYVTAAIFYTFSLFLSGFDRNYSSYQFLQVYLLGKCVLLIYLLKFMVDYEPNYIFFNGLLCQSCLEKYFIFSAFRLFAIIAIYILFILLYYCFKSLRRYLFVIVKLIKDPFIFKIILFFLTVLTSGLATAICEVKPSIIEDNAPPPSLPTTQPSASAKMLGVSTDTWKDWAERLILFLGVIAAAYLYYRLGNSSNEVAPAESSGVVPTASSGVTPAEVSGSVPAVSSEDPFALTDEEIERCLFSSPEDPGASEALHETKRQ